MSIHFWRIAIVTGVLPSRDSEIKGAIVRIAKTNTILKRLINKLFPVENTYQGTSHTGKARRENMNVNCVNVGGGVFKNNKF